MSQCGQLLPFDAAAEISCEQPFARHVEAGMAGGCAETGLGARMWTEPQSDVDERRGLHRGAEGGLTRSVAKAAAVTTWSIAA